MNRAHEDEAAAAPTDRLFFALFPDPPAARQIEMLAQRLRRTHGLTGKPTAAPRLHVTLVFLGDHVGLPPDLVALASQVADRLEAPATEVRFDRVESFRRRRGLPLVLRSGTGGELVVLQRVLKAALQEVGLARDSRPVYTPHLTLLRDDRCLAAQAVEPIAWTAREFVLVDSLLGRSRHVVLARWPLRG